MAGSGFTFRFGAGRSDKYWFWTALPGLCVGRQPDDGGAPANTIALFTNYIFYRLHRDRNGTTGSWTVSRR